jgi:tetratricopeptide (TPR) repeat protein
VNYAYKYRGVSRAYLRDRDGAMEDLNQSEKLSENDPWTYAARAGLRYARKEYEGAIDDATKAIDLMQTNAASYRIRGYARSGLRDFENALADLNEANRLSLHDPETLGGRGLVKMQQGNLKGAAEDLATAAGFSPTNLTVMLGQASIKKKSGDSEGAAAMLRNIVKTFPKYKLPEAFEFMGFLQSEMSQFTPALENLRKAVEIDSRLYYAHFGIWILRARMGERDEATKELRASMKAWDDDERSKWSLCIGRFLTGEMTESNLLTQATESAVRVTDEPSQKCEALYFAGMKRLIDGDKIGATDLFEKCVASGEDNDEQYFSAKAEFQKLKKP